MKAAYLIDTTVPSLPAQRNALSAAGCEMFFCDLQGQFTIPFMQRPEAQLLCMKLKAGDTLVVHSSHLLGLDLADLLLFAANRGVTIHDINGLSPETVDIQEHQSLYLAEADRLRQIGVPWSGKEPPLGWRRKKQSLGSDTLVRNSKQRAWCEMLLCLVEEHGFTRKDFTHLWKLPLSKCLSAAKSGFPTSPDPVIWADAPGGEDRITRRRQTYLMILGVLNGRGANLYDLYKILQSKGEQPTYLKRRVYELVRMGAVVRKVEEGFPTYYRNWDWIGDAQPFSLIALCRTIHQSPATAGDLSRKFLSPRWLIAEVIAAVAKLGRIKVEFDAKHRAIYRLASDPEAIDYHTLKQRLKFAPAVLNGGSRTSRLRALATSETPPQTSGIVRPKRDRGSSRPGTSRRPDPVPAGSV